VGADPASAVRKHQPYRATKRYLAEHEPGEERPLGHPFSKSEFFARPLPADAVAALLEHFSTGRVAGQSRELDFTPWGGAYNRVPADATAFVHRQARFLLKHAVVVDPTRQAPNGRPHGDGWRGRGRRCIRGGRAACTRTSRTPTWMTRRAPTTAATSTACSAPRPATTPTASSRDPRRRPQTSAARRREVATQASSVSRARPSSIERAAASSPSIRLIAASAATSAAAVFSSTISRAGPP